MSIIDELVARITALESQIKAQAAQQSLSSTVTVGLNGVTVSETRPLTPDEKVAEQASYSELTGEESVVFEPKIQIGQQPDGTHAITYKPGPVPPSPGYPSVDLSATGTVKISWDGTFNYGALNADGSIQTVPPSADTARVDVLIADTNIISPGVNAPVVASFTPNGGQQSVTVPMPSGDFYAALVAVTLSGVLSVINTYGPITVQGVPSVDQIVAGRVVTYSDVADPSPLQYPDTTASSYKNGDMWFTKDAGTGNVTAVFRYETAVPDGGDGTTLTGTWAPVELTGQTLAAGTVTALQLAADSVDATKIVAESITGDQVAANTILTKHVAANQITAELLAANAVTADKISGQVLTGVTLQTADTGKRIILQADTSGTNSAAIYFWTGDPLQKNVGQIVAQQYIDPSSGYTQQGVSILSGSNDLTDNICGVDFWGANAQAGMPSTAHLTAQYSNIGDAIIINRGPRVAGGYPAAGASTDIPGDLKVDGFFTKTSTGVVLGSLVDTGWQPLTLQNSWVALDATTYHTAAYRVRFGTVELRGVIKGGTLNATVATLPAGARPTLRRVLRGTAAGVTTGNPSTGTVHTHTTADIAARIDVAPDGSIVTKGLITNSYLSLDGISFSL